MYVKNRMTKHPICIDVNSKISDVVDIMSEKELHRIRSSAVKSWSDWLRRA